MSYRLEDLAAALGVPFEGQSDLVIDHACGLSNASSGGLCYLTTDQNITDVKTSALLASQISAGLDRMPKDVAVIVKPSVRRAGYNLLVSEDPLRTHVAAAQLLHPKPKSGGRIHESVVIGENVTIGEGVTIDPNCVIYDDVTIGDGTVLYAGVTVMHHVSIGKNCVFYPNSVVREDSQIGDRVVIHACAVIGSDGHGYYQREGQNLKLPQIGHVVIGDDVEIGSCSTIDRGRLEPTIIGSGVKLDNQVQIGHNVDLGDHALISAQSAIGGSSKVGHHLILGGQAGIVDHVLVGDHVSAVARTAITSRTRDKSVVGGMPSRPINDWKTIEACLGRIESLFRRVAKLEASD